MASVYDGGSVTIGSTLVSRGAALASAILKICSGGGFSSGKRR